METVMIKWVVDSYIFENNKIPKETFDALGIEVFEFDYIPFLKDDIKVPYSTKEPVVIYTTINCIQKLKNFYGCYFNDLRYDCNVYMSQLANDSRYFLNYDHIYCSFANLKADYNYYFDLFGTDHLFFRPNKGIKEFTGGVFSRDTLPSELNAIEYMYNIDASAMILISTPKRLDEETRFIIGNKEIIDASRYRVKGKFKEDNEINPISVEFVNKVLEETSWVPDDLFVMDIALTEDGPKIIELNAFSCSGWYAGMNKKNIIKRVSEIVKENFEKENNNNND